LVLERRLKREPPAIKTVEISDPSGEIVSLIPFEGPRLH